MIKYIYPKVLTYTNNELLTKKRKEWKFICKNLTINKKKEEDEEAEDDEHLKRVKKELLESLKRVDILEKKIFEEKDKDKMKNIKVKSRSQKEKNREQ